MPQGTPSANKQARVIEKAKEQEAKGRPTAKAGAWSTANKLHGGGKKIASGRKVPNGPVGGLGRKTNLTRSS